MPAEIVEMQVKGTIGFRDLFQEHKNVICCNLGLRTRCMSTYLSIPSRRCLCFFETRAPPPQAASTCSQILYLEHMSAISGIGSNAPSTVVPRK
jgi:hypothetical protein